jgi:Uma2 family endonuclease
MIIPAAVFCVLAEQRKGVTMSVSQISTLMLDVPVPVTKPGLRLGGDSGYPTSDGRPMGESDLHRALMADLIETLMRFYKGEQVYVSGNLLLFYRPGDKRRHVSPDVLVTKGLEAYPRLNYIVWQEKLPPNFVIEITSASTRREDTKDKFKLYRDEIGVAEYFLFDPKGEYLTPQLQGW